MLPPPRSPDTVHRHLSPTYPPHPYQRYPQDRRYPQYQRPVGSSGQWYPGGNNAQYSPVGWPPPAQWSYAGWDPTPPPRRSSTLARLLLGLVGAGAAMFFALIVLGALVSGAPATAVGGDIASREPAPATDPNTEPVNPQNAVAVLEGNTLYDQGGLRNGNCPAEDVGAASTAEQTRFYQSLMGCLNQEWRRPVESAGYSYTEPGLVVFDAPVSTPCGGASPESGRTLAFYCPSDEVMYADVPQMRRFFGDIDIAYAVVIGHEFGHHVQSETGLLAAFDDVVYNDFADRTELSRRLELQASCMGGLFLGAVAETFPVDETRFAQLQQVAGAFGDEPNAAADERDHGSGESNRAWILQGFTTNDVAACNTFAVPTDDVD